LLETGFGFEYGGIIVERGAEDLVQSDSLRGTHKATRKDCDEEPSPYAVPKAGHVVLWGAQAASLLSSAACRRPRNDVQQFIVMNVR